MICKNCGFELDDNSTFCPACGAATEGNVSQTNASANKRPAGQFDNAAQQFGWNSDFKTETPPGDVQFFGAPQQAAEQPPYAFQPVNNQQFRNSQSQPGYTMPPFGYPQNPGSEEPMSVKSWLGTIILSMIPYVNIVLLLMWAFGSKTTGDKKNFAKAMLIYWLIGYAVGIVIGAIGLLLMSALGISPADLR